MTATFAEATAPSPIGQLRIVATDDGLAYVGTPGERPIRYQRWAQRRLAGARRVDDAPALAEAVAQLDEYFAGLRRAFNLQLDQDGTPFQRKVWDALVRIPFAETRTYAQLAREIGSPGADRAVGSANGANPISIIVPCHRIVGADGALTGYAGGMPTKAKLLKHEGALLQGQSRLPA